MTIVVRGAAEVAALLLSVFSTVWIARAVGPSQLGYYAVTLTILQLASSLINFGLASVGSQAVVNSPEHAGQIWRSVVSIRVVLGAFYCVTSLAVLAIAPIDPTLRHFLQISTAVIAILPFRSEWLFVATGQVYLLAAIRVASAAAVTLVAVFYVTGPGDAGRLPLLPVVATSAAIVVSSGPLFRIQKSAGTGATHWQQTATLFLSQGLHYLKSDIATFIFTSSDRVFLYVFATPAIVGLYEAAYRVIQPFYTVSVVISDALYLKLGRAFGTPRLVATMRRFVDLMFLPTIPLGFFLAFFGSQVALILYGPGYVGAGELLSILGWVITFGYTSGVLLGPFTVWNRARDYGNGTLLGGVTNLASNALLIPPLSGSGAALGTVIAKVAMTMAGLRLFVRVVEYPILRDLADYFAASGLAFIVTTLASRVLLLGPVADMVIFAAAYLSGIAYLRVIRPGRSRFHRKDERDVGRSGGGVSD